MSVETLQVNGFKVEILQDEDCESPRNMTHGCELAMAHRRYKWPNDADIDFDAFQGWGAIEKYLREEYDALLVEPIYVYIHSGIAFSVGSPGNWPDQEWDAGVAGLGYVTKANWAETQGSEWAGSDEQRARAHELIVGDVDEYGSWANGECYGYIIKDRFGEEYDSCWGFIGYDSSSRKPRARPNAWSTNPSATAA